jgi:four helix bundle protein
MESLRVPGEIYPSPPEGDSGPRVSEDAPGCVGEKAFEFALTIVALCKTLEESGEEVLARQLLRAGTGVGATLEEVGAAEGRRDFDRRMAGASRQARQTYYWLRLLSQSGIAPEIDYESNLENCLELIRLLDAAARTTPR